MSAAWLVPLLLWAPAPVAPEPAPLAVLAALEAELDGVAAGVEVVGRPLEAAGRRVVQARLGGREVLLARTGATPEAAAAIARWLIEERGVAGIVSIGPAGALDPGLAVGDVVAVTAAADEGRDSVPLAPFPGCPVAGRAAAVSVERFVASRAAAAALRARSGAGLVDAGAGAIAGACAAGGIPCALAREVTDRADEAAPAAFRAAARSRRPRTVPVALCALERLATTGTAGEDRAAGARAALSQARRLYRERRFEEEAAVLEAALAAGIDDPLLAAEARHMLGRALQQLGQGELAELAVAHFLAVWQTDGSPWRAGAAQELGDLALAAGDHEGALGWWTEVVALEPRGKLGFLARDKIERLARAGAAAEIATEPSSSSLSASLDELSDHLAARRWAAADALAASLLAAAPDAAARAALSLRLVSRYWAAGSPEGAARHVPESLLTAGDQRLRALVLAGHVARALDDPATALARYGEAIAAAPASPRAITAYQQSVRLHLRAGREADALALAASGRAAFAGSPDLAAYLDRIANALRERAHPDWPAWAALVADTSATELGRRALQQLANQARLSGDREGAADLYARLVARPSAADWRSNADMALRLVDARLALGDAAGADAAERALLAGAPSPEAAAYARFRAGRVRAARGQHDLAESHFQALVREHPGTAFAAMAELELARGFEARGDLAAAAAAAERYLAAAEGDERYRMQALALVVRLHLLRGDAAAAGLHLDRARLLASEVEDPWLALDLAQLYHRRADRALAAELLERGLDLAGPLLPELPAEERLRFELLAARRLEELGGRDGRARLVARLQAVEGELLAHPGLDPALRVSGYYLLIRGLESSGRTAEAEAATARAAEDLPEGDGGTGHLLYRLSQQARRRGEALEVRELAARAFAERPTDRFAQLLLLEAAAEDYERGDLDAAAAKLAALAPAVAAGERSGWAEHFRWDVQYLEGRLLMARGQAAAGRALVDQALAKKPGIPLARRLAPAPEEP